MNKKVSTLIFLLVLSVVLDSLPQSLAVGREPKIIVVPDDYSTIQSAINSAKAGDTIFVSQGTYDGPMNQTISINKSISIIGENPETTIFNLHPNYTVTWITMQAWYSFTNAIEINANNVKLINLTLDTDPGGLILANNNGTQIINCIITKGITVKGINNTISKNKVNYRLTLENSSFNTIFGNTVVKEYIYLRFSNSNVISNNSCLGFAMSGLGDTSSDNIFSRNIMDGKNYGGPIVIAIGIYGTNNVFHDNYIANYNILKLNKGKGVSLASIAVNNTFYRNNFINNAQNAGAESKNFWDNGVEGNYWSDYNGTDKDGDGIGDTPYIINENNQDNYPLMEPISLDSLHESSDNSSSIFRESKFQVHDTHAFYKVTVVSNSTISGFNFLYSVMRISFYVNGTAGTTGLCNVSIPSEFMSTQFSVFKDEKPLTKNTDYTQTFNGTHYLFTITYDHSSHLIQIYANNNIPEFPSWTQVLVMACAGAFLCVVYKRKMHQQSTRSDSY